ncbi:unnamed protein product [Jaminaea pallidilutea]
MMLPTTRTASYQVHSNLPEAHHCRSDHNFVSQHYARPPIAPLITGRRSPCWRPNPSWPSSPAEKRNLHAQARLSRPVSPFEGSLEAFGCCTSLAPSAVSSPSPSGSSICELVSFDLITRDAYMAALLRSAGPTTVPLPTAPPSPAFSDFPSGSQDGDVEPLALEHVKIPGVPSPIFSGSVESQLRAVLRNVDVDECDANGENAFFVADLSEVYRQHIRWLRALPRIIPFYAVKCNPDPHVLRLLAAMGTGFDCASNGEINAVLEMGISPSRIIYANPCKAASFVRNAAANGVSLTTFDNIDELHKMKRFHPNCKLVVRILTDDSKSACQLGLKFGAPLDVVPKLLAKARELELDVVGVSFHVGSGCYDPNSFADAVARARRAFDYGRDAGYTFDLLDVGGGYDHVNFETIADVLRPALDEHFPDADFAPGGTRVEGKTHGLRIIAEPGRYYVQKAYTLACNIIAKRDGRSDDEREETEQGEPDCRSGTKDDDDDKPQIMYYQNDGVYGAFNNTMFDHQSVEAKVLTLQRKFVYENSSGRPSQLHTPSMLPPALHATTTTTTSSSSADSLTRHRSTVRPCSIWGPTCDSIDLVVKLARLPEDLEVGDWLVYEDMGAYTICASSCFNGLRRSEVRYTFGGGDSLAAAHDAAQVRELLMGFSKCAA